MMTIECTDFEEFLNTIKGLVIRGLTFSANTNTMKITLTGGY
jgi:hypothetical protein